MICTWRRGAGACVATWDSCEVSQQHCAHTAGRGKSQAISGAHTCQSVASMTITPRAAAASRSAARRSSGDDNRRNRPTCHGAVDRHHGMETPATGSKCSADHPLPFNSHHATGAASHLLAVGPQQPTICGAGECFKPPQLLPLLCQRILAFVEHHRAHTSLQPSRQGILCQAAGIQSAGAGLQQ